MKLDRYKHVAIDVGGNGYVSVGTKRAARAAILDLLQIMRSATADAEAAFIEGYHVGKDEALKSAPQTG
jgi:hypothetical protein